MASKKNTKKPGPTKASSATKKGRVEKTTPMASHAPTAPRRGPRRKAKNDGNDGASTPPAQQPAKRTRKRRPAATVPLDGEVSTTSPSAAVPPQTAPEEDVTLDEQTDEFRHETTLALVSREYQVTLVHKKKVRGKTTNSTNEDATLRVELKVFHDPAAEFTSRLGYSAKVSLIHSGEDATKSQDEQIGYIHSWRIDKRTLRTGVKADKTAWVNEFLIPDPTVKKFPLSGSESALCLQALFNDSGNVRSEVEAFEDSLEDEAIMFIQMVYTFPRFQDKGLLKPILTAYHELLGDLPDWYGFDGSAVLVPSKPGPPRGASWKNKSLLAIEGILTEAYQRHGGYAVWADEVMVHGHAITVMGRRQL